MITAFGESALLVELDSSQRAQALAASLRDDPITGVSGLVPGLSSLLVELEPLTAGPDAVARSLEERLLRAAEAAPAGRVRTIPVVYGGTYGPDLPEIAAMSALSPAEVIERHSATPLRVLFLGFAPGFAYLGDLPPEIRVPRLATPRTRTPAGSVALAGAVSGIYPAELPGGWRVIGRTPIALFDPLRDPPAYLAPGDSVRFAPITEAEWRKRAGPTADWG